MMVSYHLNWLLETRDHYNFYKPNVYLKPTAISVKFFLQVFAMEFFKNFILSLVYCFMININFFLNQLNFKNFNSLKMGITIALCHFQVKFLKFQYLDLILVNSWLYFSSSFLNLKFIHLLLQFENRAFLDLDIRVLPNLDDQVCQILQKDVMTHYEKASLQDFHLNLYF